MVVVGIDHNLFNDNFRVNHDDLQDMLARGDALEGSVEPAEVVEYLIAAG